MRSTLATQVPEDTIGSVLKWILLLVAIACFAALAWVTTLTYQGAPPISDRFETSSGVVVMTAEDVVAGKAGFQKADLMDYGSIYGMGSYFGEDYTADHLVGVAQLTEANIAETHYGRPLAALPAEQQAAVRTAMQEVLQGVDLTTKTAVLPDPLARAIATRRGQIIEWLLHQDYATGWTQAYSLDETSAKQTADLALFLADNCRTQAGFERIMDTELAVRTARWQHAHHQHLHVDLDQHLLHLFCLRRGAVHL